MSAITEQNLSKFRKAYLDASKQGQESFMFKKSKILVTYAKYVLEYVDSLKIR